MKTLFQLALLALVFVAGCGKSTGQISVSGTVELNGKTIEGASVLIVPESRLGLLPADGVTNANGKFTLATNLGPGAKPGDFKVAIRLVKLTGVATEPGGVSGRADPNTMQQEWVIPQRYSSVDTSQLTLTVKKGMEHPLFKLTSP